MFLLFVRRFKTLIRYVMNIKYSFECFYFCAELKSILTAIVLGRRGTRLPTRAFEIIRYEQN